MNIKDFSYISATADVNKMGLANAIYRDKAIPLERWSVFGSYDDASSYVDSKGLAYEGQVVVISGNGGQSAYIVDSKAPDGLKKLASGADVDDVISNYLDKRVGGEVSGNIRILSGNYIQNGGSYTGGISSIANGQYSFAHGNQVSAIGDNSYAIGKNSVAGCYGWYYDHIDFDNNAFYLTTTQPQTTYTSSLTGVGEVDSSFNSGFEVGDIISYVNKAKFDLALSVVAVNGNQISVEPFKNTSKYKLDETTPNHDDWTIFCPSKPLAGEIWLGETAHAEGLSCNAINAYSHAEGRKNLAYGQYSHVEGYGNRGAYATHAEGKGNYADGQYSHAEGWNNRTTNNCSHAEGNETSAINTCAHSQGYHTLASGEYSFAGGKYTTAFGSQSVAFGNSSEANGGSSFASGWKCVADKDNTYAFGLCAIADHKESFVWNAKSNERYVSKGQGTFNINPKDGAAGVFVGISSLADLITAGSSAELTNYLDKRTGGTVSGDIGVRGTFIGGEGSAANGNNTFAYGNSVSAIGNNSQAFGNKTYANGYCSFAGGDSTSALTSEAFAIGWKTSASGLYSFAGGQNTKSTANQTFAFGNTVEANGGSALAHGYKTIANEDNTYCLGLNAKAKDLQSFVWSGIYSPSDVKYESQGESTFCINPKDGAAGVFIGTKNLDTIIAEKAGDGSKVAAKVMDALQAAGVDENTALSDVNIGNLITFLHELAKLVKQS